MPTRLFGLFLGTALATSTGCITVTQPDAPRWGRYEDDDDDEDDDGPSDAKLAARAETILKESCAACHSNGEREGGFGNILDPNALIESGRVEPGEPGDSLLWDKVRSGEMPPDEGLSGDDKDALEAWIKAGAPAWGD
jgi:mono/diheme cytochrome c family protein